MLDWSRKDHHMEKVYAKDSQSQNDNLENANKEEENDVWKSMYT